MKKSGLDIILVGAPGSGKGTQAERICKEFNIQHVATGDLFRENLKKETELGKLAKSYMDKGELVPDDVTCAMLKDRISRPDVEAGFLLDGFPRNLQQADMLRTIMSEMGRWLAGVVYINVADEEIVSRLSGRIICKECQAPFHKTYNPFKTCPINKCTGEFLYQRDDDKPETVESRLETYHDQTEPLIGYYLAAELLAEIPGVGSVDDISKQVLETVRKLNS